MGRLHVEGSLAIRIDGRAARLRGDGDRLVLDLERAGTLRAVVGQLRGALGTDATLASGSVVARGARALAAAGLTVDVIDARGPLLRLGSSARTSGTWAPGFGRVPHLELAGPWAAVRLAFAR